MYIFPVGFRETLEFERLAAAHFATIANMPEVITESLKKKKNSSMS